MGRLARRSATSDSSLPFCVFCFISALRYNLTIVAKLLPMQRIHVSVAFSIGLDIICKCPSWHLELAMFSVPVFLFASVCVFFFLIVLYSKGHYFTGRS